jgi:ribosome-binding factor A
MKSRYSKPAGKPAKPQGPSQRQLRAGELIRHALVEVLREAHLYDEALVGVSVTITEVRMGPDLRHATCFVEPLGAAVVGVEVAAANTRDVIKALNRASKILRGELGRHIEMKFTPELRFVHDESFETAAHLERLFSDPRVRRDLEAEDEGED